ncbi:MAG: hypothetical protein RL701_3329 [Pseudomonadota bacterium]
MAHGAWREALVCQPIGAVLFGCLCAALPLSVFAAMRGSSLAATWTRLRLQYVCVMLACALLTAWLVRIARLLAA